MRRMIQLIYCSQASAAPTSDELHALLAQSRGKNDRLDVSGILVYEDGVFLQVLEGPDEAVLGLRETIECDPRHHGFRQLHLAAIEGREFGDWSMAFAAPDAGRCTVDGYIDLARESMGGGLAASKAQQMLTLFEDGLLRPAPASSATGRLSVTMAPAPRTTNARLDARSGKAYLAQLAHAIALSMPDVGVTVEISPGDLISYNVHRDLMRGEVELF